MWSGTRKMRLTNGMAGFQSLPFLTNQKIISVIFWLKYTFICVYWWTRQRIHNILIVVDRYLRLTGDKTIPDSAEPRLESFYPLSIYHIKV